MKPHLLAKALVTFLLLHSGYQIFSQADQWKRSSINGADFDLALNRVVKFSGGGRREMYLYVEPEAFTHDNIRKIFAGLAAKYPKPVWLDIDLYSDKKALEISMKLGTAEWIIHFKKTPAGQLAQQQWNERFGKLPEKYLKASYFRIERNYYSTKYFDEEYSYTPSSDSREMVEVTLQSKPPPPYSGNLNKDIVIAVSENDLKKVEELLAKGARVNITDDDGDSILMIAVLSVRDHRLVQALIKARADVNYKNRDSDRYSFGQTALIYAASAKNVDVFRTLVEAGADVNAQNGYGYSPLMMASKHGEVEMVELLLAKGVNTGLKDKEGKTAADMAKTREVRETILQSEKATRVY